MEKRRRIILWAFLLIVFAFIFSVVAHFKPSASGIRASVSANSESRDKIVLWLQTQKIAFSEERVTQEIRTQVIDPSGTGLPYDLRKFGFTQADLARTELAISFRIQTRWEIKEWFSTPYLNGYLLYDRNGRLVSYYLSNSYSFL